MLDVITSNLSQFIYFISALFFIFGLKKMNSPLTTQKGLVLISVGILLAVIMTFYHAQIAGRFFWAGIAVLLGAALAYIGEKKATTISTPQIIALFNGLGAGAVTLIAAFVLIRQEPMSEVTKFLAITSALIGSISFAACMIAAARLSGLIKTAIHLPMHQWLNALLLVIAITFGIAIVLNGNHFEMTSLIIFFVVSLTLGTLIAMPINEKDMSMIIALLVGLTGLAIGFKAYVLSNTVMMIAGSLVAAVSTKLAFSMSRSLSRPLISVIFGTSTALGTNNNSQSEENTATTRLETIDAATILAFSRNVIIVPGYGMAVAQAQHKVMELHKLLSENKVQVKYAIHPVAGRMPGHMNVLLAEADIPYDCIYDVEEINDEFASTDVVLVVGANDTVNLAAYSDQSSQIFGTPVLQADKAKHVIVIKRGAGTGYANINNPLFHQENTGMLYGDAHLVLSKLIMEIKKIR